MSENNEAIRIYRHGNYGNRNRNLSCFGCIPTDYINTSTRYHTRPNLQYLCPTARQKMYRDGALVATNTGSAGPLQLRFIKTACQALNLNLGSHNGRISKFVVYNRVLSDGERSSVNAYLSGDSDSRVLDQDEYLWFRSTSDSMLVSTTSSFFICHLIVLQGPQFRKRCCRKAMDLIIEFSAGQLGLAADFNDGTRSVPSSATTSGNEVTVSTWPFLENAFSSSGDRQIFDSSQDTHIFYLIQLRQNCVSY